jgi:hypothetical protein
VLVVPFLTSHFVRFTDAYVNCFRMDPQPVKHSNMFPVKLVLKKQRKWVLNTCYGM